MIYKCTKEYKIIPEGTILKPNEDGKYIFYNKTEEGIEQKLLVEVRELENKDYFSLQEKSHSFISEPPSKEVKYWKLVLRLKCSEEKLYEIDQEVKQLISKYLL